MIVHCEKTIFSLLDYGISVPLCEERVTRTVAWIYDHCPHRLHSISLFPASIADVLRVHTREYAEHIFSSDPSAAILATYELDAIPPTHRPFSELVHALLLHVSGTYAAAQLALKHGQAFFLGGGMHHAFPETGRGFCLVHDIAIAIRRLQCDREIQHAWVIDLDAHMGDGTARIFFCDPDVQTLSIHMREGWPFSADGPIPIPSSIDIPIAAGEESYYVSRLREGLERLQNHAPIPDLAIVVLGSDPWEHDALMSASVLALSESDMYARDALVHRFLRSLDVPILYVMGGGYGPRSWEMYAQFIEKTYILR